MVHYPPSLPTFATRTYCIFPSCISALAMKPLSSGPLVLGSNSRPALPMRGFLPLPVPTLRDLMASPPITVEASTMLLGSALPFRSSSIRYLPVLQDGKLVGLLPDRDIQRCAPSRLIPVTEDIYNGVFAGNTVERVMTRDPRTVPPDLSLTDAISQMQQARYGCLLVMEQDQLVGILTRSDLVDALQRLLSGQSIKRPQES